MEWIVNKALKESGRLKTKRTVEHRNYKCPKCNNRSFETTRLLQQVVDGAKFSIYRTDDLQRFRRRCGYTELYKTGRSRNY